MASGYLLQERKMVVLRLPQRHRHGRSWCSQSPLRHVRPRLASSPMDKDIEDVDKPYEWLHSEHSSAAGDIFGEPQRTARIGDEYQAQIPFLMTENEQLMELPTSQDAKIDVQNKFRIGLSIPVVWIRNQHKNKKEKAAKGKCGHSGSGTDSLVPGSPSESWSVIEHDSFLVGLYIFGKNLRLVNKFVGNKGMRNVVSYYYGKFYRSSEHQKWSRFRKKRSRKSVPGKKIFNGWRRHELLSRLLPNVTEECKTSLTQDGIGLSKERLNDIFWEAVWPRLLARGWHSEQPRNYAFQNSKQSLVFLAPGVTKFSRRSLEKGSQYFDSFTELLNKVASEPWLLEPEQDRLVEPQGGSDDKQDLMKCTIVDTSLVGVVKVRELTSLPVPERPDIQSSSSVSGETEQDTTEESEKEDVNHNSAEIHGVVDSQDCETSSVNHLDPGIDDVKPVRKLKLICKPKAKHHQHTNTSSCEDEAMEDPCSKKKRRGLVIDLNNPRVGPDSDGDNSVFHETSTELLNAGQRHSTRNRPLSTKALEALANGFLNPKKKRRGSEDRAHRRVRAKTALVSSCGARFIENRVEGVFNGASCMVSESPK
ncbi:hypothetical protein L2E82_00051 [Cichorium intybus]|uniref:Uncharacterized protein n=1 Tax=Cichorium intybus TaxID=13427 RepID=A0ACB9GVR7_CICIN|nr:hypothetical protein L2E82_00051 [Cichorium intybus]